MKTYQDLLEALTKPDKELAQFVRDVITDYKNSDAYKTAKLADEYFRHRNHTITEYQKLLYTITGETVPDNWSANFKMASRFFYRFVTQENQYLLGNGITWTDEGTADRLGTKKYPLDNQLQKAGKFALSMGQAFGFWNLDHVEVFTMLEFAPMYDENNGSLMAGVRFWQIAKDKPLMATLYEMDGYTDYKWSAESKGAEISPKRPYKLKYRQSEADGVEIYDGENYPGFPIVPLWGNPEHQSSIIGLQEQIDCYDLIKSGYANTVDEASIVYWTIQNAGGMDDVDLAKFIERMKTVHAATVDDSGARAESHSQEAPFQSREALLARLERDLYQDAMALDVQHIASGATTATQIKAAYEPLNSKTDAFEYCVIDFLNGILALAGIEDEPSFTRSIIVNVAESLQMLIQSAQYLDEEYVTRKILMLFGDGGQAEEVLARKDEEDINRLTGGAREEEEEDEVPAQTDSDRGETV